MSVFVVGDLARAKADGRVGKVAWSDPDHCIFDVVYPDGSFSPTSGPSEFDHVDLVTALAELA